MSEDFTWRSVLVRGIVQGVGFRPAVYRHAISCGIAGSVKNTLGGVRIDAGGTADAVAHFFATLSSVLPSMAHIDCIVELPSSPLAATTFSILPSVPSGEAQVVIPPDLATCDECLADIHDPHNRRYAYAFTACAQCGPRYTMVESLPYDRERTTMRDFPLCAQCRAEYESPADRRYHAEATTCPICGPQLSLHLPNEPIVTDSEALPQAVEILRQGGIGAIKGIGGYHLCCDALNARAVQCLRERKHRPHKPFAVMAADVNAARVFAQISEAEAQLLQSPQRPIVLLQWKRGIDAVIASSLAPGNGRIGIMLPYSPLHHLLLGAFNLLVMTSANESQEPIFSTSEEVAPWLGSVVDFILDHNRRIWNKCDDSVLLVHEDCPVLIRRARGYVPLPVQLGSAKSHPTLLACGGDLKNVFALARHNEVFLSTHMGDLQNAAALENYEEQIERMQSLLRIHPEYIVHDLHPGYHSTQYALNRAAFNCGAGCQPANHQEYHHSPNCSAGILPANSTFSQNCGAGCQPATPPNIALSVQHHHAHLAACLAENHHSGPAIGLIFDGTGYGEDGQIRGGEFLVGDALNYTRLASFKPIPMPGGEKAVHEPWRMALSALTDAIGPQDALQFIQARAPDRAQSLDLLGHALSANAPFPRTSSAGRLFDIMAFLLGAGETITFEAQHALWLEAAALFANSPAAMPEFKIVDSNGMLQLDPAPFWRATVAAMRSSDADIALLSAAFHHAFIEASVRMAKRLREKTGINTAALSGGVFLNAIIATGIKQQLEQAGFCVLTHHLTPPGDGCIALGQCAVAIARLGTPIS